MPASAATSPNPQRMQEELTRIAGGVGRQFSSNEALDVILEKYLDKRPASTTPQQALNELFARALSYRPMTRAPAYFCITWEDNRMDVWNAVKAGVFDDFPIGISLLPDNMGVHGDTTTTSFSVWKARAMKNRGHEIMSGGWTEPASLFNGETGLVATGAFSDVTAFRNELIGGFLAIRDTLQLGTPRIHNWSNSSACQLLKSIVAEVFDYATVGDQTATNDLTRPVEIYSLRTLNMGYSTITGVTTIPGMVGDKYEVRLSMAESNSRAQCESYVKRAVATGGLIYMAGHLPSTWNTSLGGGADYAALRDFLSWVKTNYVDTGLLIPARPSDAFDRFYGPMSSVVNALPIPFSDIDANGQLDFMFSGNGASYVAPTITLVSSNGGWGGSPEYSLNWAAGGTGSSFWASTTSDQAWEAGKCQWMTWNRPGMVCVFECFVRVDAGVDASYIGERVGVTFSGPYERNWNRWGSSPSLEWGSGSASSEYFSVSPNDSNEPNTFTFASGDVVGTKYVHVIASWPAPSRSDYIFINLWKTAGLDANAVRVSAPSITFYPRSPYSGVANDFNGPTAGN